MKKLAVAAPASNSWMMRAAMPPPPVLRTNWILMSGYVLLNAAAILSTASGGELSYQITGPFLPGDGGEILHGIGACR